MPLTMDHSMCVQVFVSFRPIPWLLGWKECKNRRFGRGNQPLQGHVTSQNRKWRHRRYPHATNHGSLHVCASFCLIRTHTLACRMKRVGKWAFWDGGHSVQEPVTHRTGSEVITKTPMSLPRCSSTILFLPEGNRTYGLDVNREHTHRFYYFICREEIYRFDLDWRSIIFFIWRRQVKWSFVRDKLFHPKVDRFANNQHYPQNYYIVLKAPLLKITAIFLKFCAMTPCFHLLIRLHTALSVIKTVSGKNVPHSWVAGFFFNLFLCHKKAKTTRPE